MVVLKHIDYILRKMSEDDLDKVLVWRNSKSIRDNMFSDHVISVEEHHKWFKKISEDENIIYLILEYKKNPIGVVNYIIDIANKKCSWGFYLGEEQRPKGAGLVLGYLGLLYIFEMVKIHKVCGEVFAFNLPSIKLHQKLGFLEEGRFRKHILKNGKYEDLIFFSLFKEDWPQAKALIEHQLGGIK